LKSTGLGQASRFRPDAGHQSVGSLGASVELAPMGAEVRPDAQLTEAGIKNDFAQDLSSLRLEARQIFGDRFQAMTSVVIKRQTLTSPISELSMG